MLRGRVSRLTFGSAIGVTAAASLPAVYLLIRGFEGGSDEAVRVLTSARTLALLGRTLLLGATTALGAIAIGVPLAVMVVRCSVPLRRTLTLVLAMPLVIPSYLMAYTLIAFAGPHGMLSEALGITIPSIYGLPGAWLAITATTYPFVFLAVRSAMLRLDPSTEEASALLGASARETFRRVTWPAIRPAAAVGGLLVALYAIHDLGAVALLRYDTFSRAIFVAYQGSFDRSRAALLAVALVVVAVGATRLEIAARARAPISRLHGATPRRSVRRAMSKQGFVAASLGTSIVISVSVVLPIGVLVFWAMRAAGSGLSLGSHMSAAVSTITVAAMAAIPTVLAGWPIARLASRMRGRLSRSLEMGAHIGYALPGVAVALSLAFFATRIARPLYQTLTLLTFAYVILFLPQASALLRTGLNQLPPHREEASRTLGAGRLSTLRRIVLPAVAPSAIAAGILVFLTTAKELPATMLLSPPGFTTLSMRIFGEASAARFGQAALPALLLILVIAIPTALLLSRDKLQGSSV